MPTRQIFELTREYVELDSLLKLLSIAPSGGIAKLMVADGLVKVNGEVELRKTRKLRDGDLVELDDIFITVQASTQ